MKKTIIILIILLISISSQAQEIPFEIIRRINTVDYIFEGIVINKQSYQSIDHRRIYSTNLIEITKILKGNLSCGTVEIITEGGNIGTKKMNADHSLELEIESKGIFLCMQSTREIPQINYFNPTNTIKLEGTYEYQSFIKYTEDNNNNLVAHDITGNYDSLIQFYNLAQIITGFNFIDCNNSNKLTKAINYTPEPIYNPEIFTTNNSSEYLQNQNVIQIHKTKKDKKKKRIVTKIEFGMTTPIITGTNPKYCEFDINVTDNMFTKYLVIANLRIKYPSSVFGTNIINNNKIQITRGAMILDTNSYSNPVAVDLSADAIYLPITAYYNSVKSQITSIPQNLVHIKIEISNCIIGKSIKI
jgi:hypothetical protein